MLGGHLFNCKTWLFVAEFCLDDMSELGTSGMAMD
jgi:hypothetical protein